MIPDEPITLPFLDHFEGTLRWKAASFHGPASHAADLEIGLDLRDGRLRVDPIAATGTQGGYLTGRIDLESVDQGFTVQSHLRLDGGRLDLAKSEIDPSRWPSFDFDMDIGSHGHSLRELANHAKGHIGFILGEGLVTSSVIWITWARTSSSSSSAR